MKSRVRSRLCDSKALIRMGVLLPILVHIILASSGSGVFARDTISLNSGWTVSTEYESECFIGRERECESNRIVFCSNANNLPADSILGVYS